MAIFFKLFSPVFSNSICMNVVHPICLLNRIGHSATTCTPLYICQETLPGWKRYWLSNNKRTPVLTMLMWISFFILFVYMCVCVSGYYYVWLLFLTYLFIFVVNEHRSSMRLQVSFSLYSGSYNVAGFSHIT